MKHHGYAQELPKPRYINPSNVSPLVHVIITNSEGGKQSFEYSQRINPKLIVRLGLVNPLSNSYGDFKPLDEIVVDLLPPINSLPSEENRLPEYEVQATAEEIVARELFEPVKNNYLPKRLAKHPKTNLIVLTHGAIWTPEVELAIINQLIKERHQNQGLYHSVDENVRGLYGNITHTNAILLKK